MAAKAAETTDNYFDWDEVPLFHTAEFCRLIDQTFDKEKRFGGRRVELHFEAAQKRRSMRRCAGVYAAIDELTDNQARLDAGMKGASGKAECLSNLNCLNNSVVTCAS
jgi:hypothetical protein